MSARPPKRRRLGLRLAAVWAALSVLPPSSFSEDVRCAIIQFSDAHPDEAYRDADRLESFVEIAAENGARVIVAPENCLYRYTPWEQNGVPALELAHAFDDLVSRFSLLADRLDVCLVFGLREPSGDASKPTYQSAVFIDDDGEVRKTYRKRVPSSTEYEYTLSGGDDWEPFNTPYGRVWMQICKDMDGDGYVRHMPTDIDLFIGISKDRDLGWGKIDAGCAHAHCWGIGANWAGDDEAEGGNSGFVGPHGTVILEAGSGDHGANETVIYQDLPLPRPDEPRDGQIVVVPSHPEWLEVHGSGPLFLCGPGDPEDFLYRGARGADGTRSGDQMELIQKMAGTGANTLYFQAVRSHGGDGDGSHNPFVDSTPSRGLDAEILSQWEVWFRAMESNGIVIYFFFYDDSARIWNTGDAVGAEERAFIRGVVRRFEHHKLLIWCIAEEYSERYSARRVANIAAEIRSADDRDHVIAVHQLNGLTFDFPDDPNIDQFAIQYNQATSELLHQGVVTAWNRANGRYNLNMSEAAGHGGGTGMRRKNWACAMGGAYVMVLGMDVESTPLADLESCGHVVKFFTQTRLRDMKPRDDLRSGATDYVLADAGRSYILYSDGAGDLGVSGLTKGSYDLLWFDPIDGSQESETGVPVGGGTVSFSRPESVGNEAALYLVRENDPSTSFRRGDANSDGAHDLSDGLSILSFLFLGKRGPACLKSADTNDSGGARVDLSDAVYLLDYLFLGGPPPPAPFPECGWDPTPDELTCGEASLGCEDA